MHLGVSPLVHDAGCAALLTAQAQNGTVSALKMEGKCVCMYVCMYVCMCGDRSRVCCCVANCRSQKKQRQRSSSSRCDQDFIMDGQEHNNWKRSVSELSSMRCVLCGVKKQDVTSINFFLKKTYL